MASSKICPSSAERSVTIWTWISALTGSLTTSFYPCPARSPKPSLLSSHLRSPQSLLPSPQCMSPPASQRTEKQSCGMGTSSASHHQASNHVHSIDAAFFHLGSGPFPSAFSVPLCWLYFFSPSFSTAPSLLAPPQQHLKMLNSLSS